jgi:hypothetical protein
MRPYFVVGLGGGWPQPSAAASSGRILAHNAVALLALTCPRGGDLMIDQQVELEFTALRGKVRELQEYL